MTINSTTTGTNNASAATNTNANTSTQSSSSMDKLANENTFLQLFVSQLKNQDPLNPSDGTQFVSQLAQFSELEQVIGINQNVGAIRTQMATPSAAATTSDSSSAASGATSNAGDSSTSRA
jgi:flagellar basal-body rod modification protein FlgD